MGAHSPARYVSDMLPFLSFFLLTTGHHVSLSYIKGGRILD